jgi:hypothetical protein
MPGCFFQSVSEEESLCGKYNSGAGAGYRATTILRSSTAFAPQHSGTATTCLGLDAARLTSGDDGGGSVSASLRRRPTPPPVFRIQSLSVAPDSEAPPPPTKSATLEWTCGGGGRQRQSMRLAGCPSPGSGYLDYSAAPQSRPDGIGTLADFRKGASSLTVHVNHHIVPQPACNSSVTTAARRQQVESRHNGPF